MDRWVGCSPLGLGVKGASSKIARGGKPTHEATVNCPVRWHHDFGGSLVHVEQHPLCIVVLWRLVALGRHCCGPVLVWLLSILNIDAVLTEMCRAFAQHRVTMCMPSMEPSDAAAEEDETLGREGWQHKRRI